MAVPVGRIAVKFEWRNGDAFAVRESLRAHSTIIHHISTIGAVCG